MPPLSLNRRFEVGPYRRNLRAIEQWSIEVIATLPGTKIEPLFLNHSWPEDVEEAGPAYGPYRWNIRLQQNFADSVCDAEGVPAIRFLWPFDQNHYLRNVGLMTSFADAV